MIHFCICGSIYSEELSDGQQERTEIRFDIHFHQFITLIVGVSTDICQVMFLAISL